jgi:FAD:protein FMN transferase
VTSTSSFPALGTTAFVAVAAPDALFRARAILAAELDDLDRAASRFRDDSELVRANARAGEVVEVSETLATAVAAALRAARDTNGLVDPTLGADLAAAGYDRTFALVRARERWTIEPRSRTHPSWRDVELQGNRLRVPRGCALDLGATAKALWADRAAERIAGELETGVLVSLGGDVAVAGMGAWTVRIDDDHTAPLDAPGPRIAIGSGGLATSSTVVRSWRTDRGTAHHLFDPRTRRPAATPWRTVSVAARSCFDANVASTTAIVFGTGAPEWLRQRELPSRLVANDGSVVHVAGWPASEAA